MIAEIHGLRLGVRRRERQSQSIGNRRSNSL